jgi:hypothetical protein
MANTPELPNTDENSNESPVENSGAGEITFTGATAMGMYILLAGLIVGIVLSPWVLGRSFDEQGYKSFYEGAGEQWEALRENTIKQEALNQQKFAELAQQFEGIGATPVAMEAAKKEVVQAGIEAIQPYFDDYEKAKRVHQAAWTKIFVALMVAVALLMFVEPILTSYESSGRTRNKLALCRYLFMAGGITMLVANPFILWTTVG